MQLCGRILVFIVRLYPLSDKSGLNLQGAINSALPLPLDEVGMGRGSRSFSSPLPGPHLFCRPCHSPSATPLLSHTLSESPGQPIDSLLRYPHSLYRPLTLLSQVGPDDVDSVGQPIDGKLYTTFWGLQAAFKVEGGEGK